MTAILIIAAFVGGFEARAGFAVLFFLLILRFIVKAVAA